MSRLRGRVALVTGASSGIGLEIARQLIAHGVKVGLLARSQEKLTQLAAELGNSLALPADVTRYEEVERAVARLEAHFGGLDYLINNAGIGIFKPVHELSPQEWRQVIDTNLTGPFYATKAAVPAMLRSGGGHIVNIGSMAGKNAFAGGAAYNASKFGLLGFSEAALIDLRYHGIRVSSVLPGSVDTPFAGNPTGAAWKIQPEDVAQAVLYLLQSDPRITVSEVDIRPSQPPRG
ncbi:MAG: SDR family oxidoreductase [Meiothermus sp.]|uniref:SDR family oxidoreductase n=1 Tax=Meiothermus sp. TaxID=1955249 RepID=UPI0025ECC395|nr:SDR family oxidoreductase [Meiothermus sp.]MDW8217540.1 SDR family oxidoreductase [Acidobacteriota bacterium]MCS7057437.1 SDR family oxidoreductase [Meiothermus sp.]MCS7193545.1 SDR family oxidoreductase [Meiothermus sp.]MCX7739986.1 SDR family oxidoreductase [Meiothermus sp.]MDW8091608.1 SDR family oxidoreductase [Meiothermus sp.]